MLSLTQVRGNRCVEQKVYTQCKVIRFGVKKQKKGWKSDRMKNYGGLKVNR